MNASSPLLVVLGLLLIGLGLVYPLAALVRINRRLNRGETGGQALVGAVLLAALIPLTAVLAGFWLAVPGARASLVFTGALIASAVLLLAVLIASRRVGGG